eukprot:2599862-Amphidinium_carterae.1
MHYKRAAKEANIFANLCTVHAKRGWHRPSPKYYPQRVVCAACHRPIPSSHTIQLMQRPCTACGAELSQLSQAWTNLASALGRLAVALQSFSTRRPSNHVWGDAPP